MKYKPKYEEVTYEMAAPAKIIDIITWLITGGRKGKLFVRKDQDFRKWAYPAGSINCRCVIRSVADTDNKELK